MAGSLFTTISFPLSKVGFRFAAPLFAAAFGEERSYHGEI
jgi:hypothetical protein